MNVACPDCHSVFRVDPARVTTASLRAKCAVCGGLIAVGASIRWADDFPSEMRRPAPSLASDQGTTVRAMSPMARDATRDATAVVASAPMAPAAQPPTAQVPEALGVRPVDESHAGDGGVAARIPPFSPARRSTPITPTFGAPAFAASSLRPPTPAFTPPVARTDAITTGSAAPPPSAPAAPPTLVADTMSARVSIPEPGSVTPVSTAPPSGAATGGAPARRPINPFLSNDPNQKARRLARALVSDMIAYHPEKRDEGSRNGTLKQLFRDEIKKSYEEYVEQVGRDFAESTTHFQDALNDVLAAGKKIF